MRIARPSSTVTSIEQVSGQSWGQTALTIIVISLSRAKRGIWCPNRAAQMGARSFGAARLRIKCLLPLEHHGHTDSPRRADGDQAVLLACALQLVANSGHDARAGGAEGVAEGDRAAGLVDLLRIDLADRLGAAEFFLRDLLRSNPLDVREHLRGERLVHLDDFDVRERDLRALERGRQRE